MLLVYIVIALVSGTIDRRALMVAALVYVLFVFNALLKNYGAVSVSFALAAFTIGSGLLFLSALWHRFRQRILPWYPAPIRKMLPPVTLAHSKTCWSI